MRSHNPYSHTICVCKGIARPELVGIAEIIAFGGVAHSLVCRNLGVKRQFVFSIFDNIVHRWKTLGGLISCIKEFLQELSRGVVDRFNRHQFVDGFHGTVLIYILHDVHHLLVAEERQGEQLLTRGGIDVYPVALQVQQIIV